MAILKAEGIFLVNDTLQHLVDKQNNYYFLPNFILNEPIFEKVLVSEPATEKEVQILCIDVYKNERQSVGFLNTSKVGDVKAKLKGLFGYNKVRMVHSGCELEDDKKLFNYSVEDGSCLHLVTKPN